MNKTVRIVLFLVIGVVVLGSILAAGYFYRQYRAVVGDTARAEEIQNEQMLATIGQGMELPPEKPAIVTITDREKLQSQAFFQKALNGDKIIIYEAAKRVYLYRPSTKKVIDVAPLVFNDSQGTQNTTDVFNQAILPQPTAATSAAGQRNEAPASSPSATPSPTIVP